MEAKGQDLIDKSVDIVFVQHCHVTFFFSVGGGTKHRDTVTQLMIKLRIIMLI